MAILRILQDSTVPLDFLSTIAFDTTSVKTVYHHIKTVFLLKTARSKAIVTFLAMSVIWLTVMPTLLDLTTGYIAFQRPMINTSGNPNAPALDALNSTGLQQIDHVWNSLYSTGCTNLDGSWNFEGCPANATHEVSFAGHRYNVQNLIDVKTGYWIVNDDSHQDAAVYCVPQQVYSWGISSGYCWILSTLMGWWLIGICAVWFDTMRFGYLWHTGRGFGRYRNIIDIAHHIERHLGPDLCAYSHEELNRQISKLQPVGMEIVSDGQCGHIRLSNDPGGFHLLVKPSLEFGGLERLRIAGQERDNSDHGNAYFHAM